MSKKGFYINQVACWGCRTCQVACKDKNDLPIGTLFRTVKSFEKGAYPDAKLFHYPATCNHCENPACVANCPTGAMYVDEADGTVQHDDTLCIGCETCAKSCPYQVPQLIAEENIVRKCDACKQLRDNGEEPACVASCIMRALEFGDIDELRAKHPDAVSNLAILPDATQTSPCVIIAPHAAALDGEAKLAVL